MTSPEKKYEEHNGHPPQQYKYENVGLYDLEAGSQVDDHVVAFQGEDEMQPGQPAQIPINRPSSHAFEGHGTSRVSGLAIGEVNADPDQENANGHSQPKAQLPSWFDEGNGTYDMPYTSTHDTKLRDIPNARHGRNARQGSFDSHNFDSVDGHLFESRPEAAFSDGQTDTPKIERNISNGSQQSANDSNGVHAFFTSTPTVLEGDYPLPVSKTTFSLAAISSAAGVQPTEETQAHLGRGAIDEALVPRCMRVPGNNLATRMRNKQKEINQKSFSSIYYSKRPLKSMLNSKIVLIVLSVACFGYVLRNSLYHAGAVRQSTVTYKILRFTNIESRDGVPGVEREAVSIHAFGGMKDGCRLHEPVEDVQRPPNNNMTVTYRSRVTMDGFYFVTHDGPVEHDPVRFAVYGSNDGDEWEWVGSSNFVIQDNGSRKLKTSVFPTTKDRLRQVNVDHRVPWHWTLGWLGTALAFSGGMSLSVLAASLGRVQQAAALLILSWALTGLMFIIAAIANGVKNDALRSVPYLLWSSFAFMVSASFIYSSGRIAQLFILNGVYYLAMLIVISVAVYGDLSVLNTNPPVTGFVLIAAGILVYLLLYRHNRHAMKSVEDDRNAYEEMWGAARCMHGAEVALRALDTACKRAIHSGDHHPPVHFNRLIASKKRKDQLRRVLVEAQHTAPIDSHLTTRGDGGTLDIRRNALDKFVDLANDLVGLDGNNINLIAGFAYPQFVPNTIDKRSPLRSLDQVYAQATVLQPILQSKVQAWALESHGMFALQGGSPPSPSMQARNGNPVGSEPSEDGSRQHQLRGHGGSRSGPGGPEEHITWRPGLEDRIQWPQLKHVDNAIQKLTRVYKEDVSKLVDVCRHRIVFETVQDMVKCVRAIGEDLETRVLRVKNRMQPWHDSEAEGGFRNVVLSLNLTGMEPVRYGLENHVCEVQLVLRVFAEALTPERHRRYLDFRSRQRPVAVRLSRLRTLNPSYTLSTKILHTRLDSGFSRVAPDLQQMDNLSVAETVALQRTTVEGGFLHKVLKRGYTLKTANSGSVLFTAKPIETSMCYWQWQTLLLVYAVVVFALCFGIWDKWNSADYAPPYSHFRFTNVENRIGEPMPADVAIQSFGVMRDGCWSVEPTLPKSTVDKNGTMTVTYWRPVEMNGFYFVTNYSSDSSSDMDPVKFDVHGSNDDNDEKEWDRIGSSFFRIQDDGNRNLLNGKHNTPRERGAVVELNMELPWAWVLSIAGHVPWAVALTIIAISGYLQRTRGATLIFSVGMGGSCLVHSVAGLAWYVSGYWQEGLASLLFATALLGVMLLAVYKPALLVRSLAPIGVLFCLIDVFRHGILYRDLGGMAYNPPITGVVVTLSGLYAVWLRRRIVRSAKRIVEQDQAEYNQLWAEIAQREGAFEDLEAVERAAIRLVHGGEVRVMHQCKVRIDSRRDSESEGFRQSGSAYHNTLDQQDFSRFKMVIDTHHAVQIGAVEVKIPVSSLDQVYSQAAIVQPMLRVKIEEWASASEGMFPRANTPGLRTKQRQFPLPTRIGEASSTTQAQGPRESSAYVKFSEVGVSELESSIRWAALKKVERSVEKVTRVYGEDVSRLVDVCRQSIVFESVQHIALCLEAIERDREVKVVRVKNRMSGKFNANESAGFRNVALNLLIVTPEAVHAGVDAHVCEVQLMLREYADAKSNEGHQRYVRFRNLRGE